MPWRCSALLVCLLGSGCMAWQTQKAPDGNLLAEQLWEQGQAAMGRGQPDEAIPLYEQSLVADPNLNRNHLSLAAAYLAKEDLNRACPHLAEYADANPDRYAFRLHYAELLARLGKTADARLQFERCISIGQEQGASNDVIRCHGRLVQLAHKADDAYDEHLHRGIGLFLLARQRSALDDSEDELPAEGLLCKAAAELNAACETRPDEARPCWYLYEVWSHLGQRQPALCRLRKAENAGPFTYLTPTEKRGLQAALLNDKMEVVPK